MTRLFDHLQCTSLAHSKYADWHAKRNFPAAAVHVNTLFAMQSEYGPKSKYAMHVNVVTNAWVVIWFGLELIASDRA